MCFYPDPPRVRLISRELPTFRDAFEAPKRILTADALKSHLLQFKKREESTEIFGSSDESGFQQPEASPEQ